MSKKYSDITVVGYAGTNNGIAASMLSACQAFNEAREKINIFDLSGGMGKNTKDLNPDYFKETYNLSPINIFFINGDQVKYILSTLARNEFKNKYNIICPAWELSHYPCRMGNTS